MLMEGGQVINDSKQVSNIFNNFFVQTAANIGYETCLEDDEITEEVINTHDDHICIKSIKKNMKDRGHKTELVFTQVDEETVEEKLYALNPHKAAGYDGISPKFLKAGSSVLCRTLTVIFNRIITTSTYPAILKKS